MKDDFEFLRGLANCQDKEQMARYIEEHQPKPMTNGDLIRSMDDETLATQLVQVFKEGILALVDMEVPNKLLDEAWKCFLDKLKQPAEVGHGN